MLYVFAGYPRSGLNAGGLQRYVETVECLGELEHDPSIQYRKEGIFVISETGEELKEPISYHLSELCLRDGIDWRFFPDNWSFGNGVVIQKWMARIDLKTVVEGTTLSLDAYLEVNGPTQLATLAIARQHQRTIGWEEWESRWLPGTCPQQSIDVHLTCLAVKHHLTNFAYQQIRAAIEDPSYELPNPNYYSNQTEPGKYLSTTRELNFQRDSHALPQH